MTEPQLAVSCSLQTPTSCRRLPTDRDDASEKATNAVHCLRHEVGLGTTRVHDLRHYVATQLIGASYDPVTVAQWLGRAQVSTTMNINAKFLRPKDQAAANEAAALLRGPD